MARSNGVKPGKVHALAGWFAQPDEPSFDWGGGRKTMPLWKSVISDSAFFVWRVMLPLIGLGAVIITIINHT